MPVKLDKADKIFSKYIKLRDDYTCQRCRKKYPENSQGLHCSHHFGRGNESVRYDPFNCDTLCFYCHHLWGGDEREKYKEFKIKQLGEQAYKELDVRAHSYKKKDRKLAYLISKTLYDNEVLAHKYDI